MLMSGTINSKYPVKEASPLKAIDKDQKANYFTLWSTPGKPPKGKVSITRPRKKSFSGA